MSSSTPDLSWRSRISMRILAHLALFILGLAIPIWVVLVQGERMLMDQGREGARRLSRAIAGHVQFSLEHGQAAALNLLADLQSNPDQIQQKLERFLAYTDLYSNVYYYDPAGMLRAVWYRKDGTPRPIPPGQSIHSG